MANPEVRVKLTADDQASAKIEQSLNKIQGAAQNSVRAIISSFGSLGQVFSSIVSGPTALVAAIGVVGTKATQMASEVETAGRRINTVFPGIKDAARPLSDEFGVAQTSILQLFDTIERNGERTRDGLTTTARAVLDLNQALAGTPDELTNIADALDQTLDLFHLNGTEANTVAAQLFSISKGRVPLQELIDGFRASAVAIRNNDIPLELAAAGLTKLLEAGLPAKKAASELSKEIDKGADSFRAFVGPVEDTTTQLTAFQTRVRLLGEDAATTNARVRQELNNGLIDLGNVILPIVNKNMSNFLTLLDGVKGRSGAFNDLDQIGTVADAMRRGQGDKVNTTARDRVIFDLNKQLQEGDIRFGELSEGQLKDLERNLQSLGGVITNPVVEAARVRMLQQLHQLTNIPPSTPTVVVHPTEEELEESRKAMETHHKALVDLANAGRIPVTGLEELLALESDLERQLDSSNLTIERRAELVKELTTVQRASNNALKEMLEVPTDVVAPKRPERLESRTVPLDIVPEVELPPTPTLPTLDVSSFATSFAEAMEPLTEFTNATWELNESLSQIAGHTLVNLSAGFATAFEGIGQGKNVFKSLGKAVKDSVAQAAAAEGRQEFARGFAALGQGLLGNPGGFASATQHFTAGALFSALAGMSGGSGGKGGGGTSAYQRQRDFGTTGDTENVKQGDVVITIQGGILDMSDPRQANAFADAIGKLTDRRVITVGV